LLAVVGMSRRSVDQWVGKVVHQAGNWLSPGQFSGITDSVNRKSRIQVPATYKSDNTCFPSQNAILNWLPKETILI
jgi:hypothetical protein